MPLDWGSSIVFLPVHGMGGGNVSLSMTANARDGRKWPAVGMVATHIVVDGLNGHLGTGEAMWSTKQEQWHCQL